MAAFIFTPAVLEGVEIISKFDETEGRENKKEIKLTK